MVLAGLGNPGPEYARTRHNLGYAVVEAVAGMLGASFRTVPRARIARASVAGAEVLLLKPTTFMNLSGAAVAPLMRRKGIPAAGLLVIHDDLDTGLGRVRLRRGGSAGGHRGVQSIIEAVGSSDFARLKIGIGRPPDGVDPVDYVLQRPLPEEKEALTKAVSTAAAACRAWLEDGLEAAMNAFNSPCSTDETCSC